MLKWGARRRRCGGSLTVSVPIIVLIVTGFIGGWLVGHLPARTELLKYESLKAMVIKDQDARIARDQRLEKLLLLAVENRQFLDAHALFLRFGVELESGELRDEDLPRRYVELMEAAIEAAKERSHLYVTD